MRLIDADALRAEWVDAVGIYTGSEVVNSIDDTPTVIPEMSAVEYARARERMCTSYEYCDEGCPLNKPSAQKTGYSCTKLAYKFPEEVVRLTKAWAQEHPEIRANLPEYCHGHN